MTKIRLPDADLDGFDLESAEARAAEYPDSFEIPDRDEREALEVGEHAKLLMRFILDDPEEPEAGERIWVVVSERTDDGYLGLLANCPACLEENDELWLGSEISFHAEHIIDIMESSDASIEFARSAPLSRWPRDI